MGSDQEPRGRIPSRPVRELTLTVVLTGLALILSVAIGDLRVVPVLLASCVVLVSTALGVNLCYRVLKIEAEDQIGSREIEQKLGAVDQQLSLIEADLANLGRSYPLFLISDQQYSQVESAETTKRVIICKQNMGSEFDPDPTRRDSLISYDRIVVDNIRRRVRYHWIAPDNDRNRLRAEIIRRRFPPELARITLLSWPEWLGLPFSLETVFILTSMEDRQRIEGFIQVPISENLQERSWIRMQPDTRDEWLGSAMRFVGEDFLS